MRWKPSTRTAWQLVAAEAVVVDLASGRTVGLNPTGSVIWSQIAQEKEESDIVSNVAGTFGITEELASRDVTSFLRLLSERNLIEPLS
jgi:hypothetical protein